MKALGEFLFGMILAIIGGMIFLSNVTVYGMYSGFFSFSNSGMFHTGTSTIAMIVVLLCVFFFLMIANPNFLTKTLTFVTFLLFVVAMLLSLNFGFKRMSAFSLFAMLALFIAGLALIFRAVMGLEKAEKEAKEEKKRYGLDDEIDEILKK